jgi:hypothetical protein
MMRVLAWIAVLIGLGGLGAAGAGTARAERRRNALADSPRVLVLRTTDRGRWEAGAGASGGWLPLLDLHVRYYVADSATIGPRLRLDLGDAAPRAIEAEIGKAIGIGKMLFLDDLMARTRLVVTWGTGAVRVTDGPAPYGFVGLALRVQPLSWLSIEVGAREAVAVRPATATARSTAPSPPAGRTYGLVTELGASIAVLWPAPRRECVWR